MEWMILPLKRYFQISGRSRRREYWMFWLFTIIGGIVAGILDTLLGFGSVDAVRSGSSYYAGWNVRGPINTIFDLLIIVPSLTVAIRRLHDTDRSGWWLLLLFVPIIGWIALFVFYVLDGTRGANRFGPDPKDPAGTDDAREVFG